MTLADSVETLGVDPKTKVKRQGAKEKARRKKCNVVFSFMKKNKAFSKGLHESGHQEVVTWRYDATKNLENPCSRDVSDGEGKVEEANGD